MHATVGREGVLRVLVLDVMQIKRMAGIAKYLLVGL